MIISTYYIQTVFKSEGFAFKMSTCSRVDVPHFLCQIWHITFTQKTEATIDFLFGKPPKMFNIVSIQHQTEPHKNAPILHWPPW